MNVLRLVNIEYDYDSDDDDDSDGTFRIHAGPGTVRVAQGGSWDFHH